MPADDHRPHRVRDHVDAARAFAGEPRQREPEAELPLRLGARQRHSEPTRVLSLDRRRQRVDTDDRGSADVEEAEDRGPRLRDGEGSRDGDGDERERKDGGTAPRERAPALQPLQDAGREVRRRRHLELVAERLQP